MFFDRVLLMVFAFFFASSPRKCFRKIRFLSGLVFCLVLSVLGSGWRFRSGSASSPLPPSSSPFLLLGSAWAALLFFCLCACQDCRSSSKAGPALRVRFFFSGSRLRTGGNSACFSRGCCLESYAPYFSEFHSA